MTVTMTLGTFIVVATCPPLLAVVLTVVYCTRDGGTT